MDRYLIFFYDAKFRISITNSDWFKYFVQTKVTRLSLDFNLRHHEPGGALYHCAVQPT